MIKKEWVSEHIVFESLLASNKEHVCACGHCKQCMSPCDQRPWKDPQQQLSTAAVAAAAAAAALPSAHKIHCADLSPPSDGSVVVACCHRDRMMLLLWPS